MKSRLHQKYQKEIIPALQEKFELKNYLAVPKIKSISVNIGINARNSDSSVADNAEATLRRITGQKPIRTKAKQAISAFKVRQGQVVGVKVTLRGERMYDFIDKLVNVAIPRIRDFRGLLEKNVDKQGNLTLGFKEHIVFPEIKSDEVEKILGLEVSVATSAKNHEQGLELFRLLGFPFQKKS
ncbi:MAG: 50S ribosomal protein L5 [bacterium]